MSLKLKSNKPVFGHIDIAIRLQNYSNVFVRDLSIERVFLLISYATHPRRFASRASNY